MKISATTPEEYIAQLPLDRKEVMSRLRKTILENLPNGFEETIDYVGILGYVVPHSLYPKGYHLDHKIPLPFLSIASQKNFIALYHMGIYADRKLKAWFVREYPKYNTTELDMGKNCIRFKKPEQIPYPLIAELSGKISVEEWIKIYELNLLRRRLKQKGG